MSTLYKKNYTSYLRGMERDMTKPNPLLDKLQSMPPEIMDQIERARDAATRVGLGVASIGYDAEKETIVVDAIEPSQAMLSTVRQLSMEEAREIAEELDKALADWPSNETSAIRIMRAPRFRTFVERRCLCCGGLESDIDH